MARGRASMRWLMALACAGLVAVSCGDNGGKGADASAPTNSVVAATTTTTKPPVSGGSLTMAMFSETRALDPVDASGTGVAGGTELIALYDTVMQFNLT